MLGEVIALIKRNDNTNYGGKLIKKINKIIGESTAAYVADDPISNGIVSLSLASANNSNGPDSILIVEDTDLIPEIENVVYEHITETTSA